MLVALLVVLLVVGLYGGIALNPLLLLLLALVLLGFFYTPYGGRYRRW